MRKKALSAVLAGILFAANGYAEHKYNGSYTGANLNRVAFPIGGIGAGMFCLDGTGSISHVSIRGKMDFFNSPYSFAALCVRNSKGNTARVLEGAVPDWKIFGPGGSANGSSAANYGFPRFNKAQFSARFPFATIKLEDAQIPLNAEITGWSPFIPTDADNSSLPAGALEYKFTNKTGKTIEAVFSFNTANFICNDSNGRIRAIDNGFVLCSADSNQCCGDKAALAVFVDSPDAAIDYGWFAGDWWDSRSLVWNNIQTGRLMTNPPAERASKGASLSVPLKLAPGQSRTIRLMFAWYATDSGMRTGQSAETCKTSCYVPWYAGKFKNIYEISDYWRHNYDILRSKSSLFTEAFYGSTLPPVVLEAIAANLTILKSPTVLRQTDGRLWAWEGCRDNAGCCPGSCTHVWNYAQAIPHLFASLERTFRQTEFNEAQDENGRQAFRVDLPIRDTKRSSSTAADGQLGGIMKVYREWRISGDDKWLRDIWPQVKRSLDFCIQTWDPRCTGLLEEPQHNTYDITYWGPNGHCSSFYLGALTAAVQMGGYVGDDVSEYKKLLEKGKGRLVSELWNGEYFCQKIQTDGLNAKYEPLKISDNGPGYREIIEKINAAGPKYQYGNGCLSDSVVGFWMAQMCGLGEIIEADKIKKNLDSVYKYNFRTDLSAHSNPQRPGYALGREAGLLICTWPKGSELLLPFVYSNEVWTGIEYQAAGHLIMEGRLAEGLNIVGACRNRYDGQIRNPFDEYECGHWYARAMSSYGLLQALTGLRYDAVEKTLYIDSRIGNNFRCFISTATGFGLAGLKNGRAFIDVKFGNIEIKQFNISGRIVQN